MSLETMSLADPHLFSHDQSSAEEVENLNQDIYLGDLGRSNEPEIPEIPVRNPDDDEELPEILKEYAKCGICLCVIMKPMTLLCQHSFCYECLVGLVKKDKSSNNNMILGPRVNKYDCPSCKEPFIFPRKNTHNVMLEDLISQLTPEDQKEQRKIVIVKREMEDKIREELRQELLGALVRNGNQDLNNNQNRNDPFMRRETYCIGNNFQNQVDDVNAKMRKEVYKLVGASSLIISGSVLLASAVAKYFF